jgi:two-component system sensor histidine kinase TtrS
MKKVFILFLFVVVSYIHAQDSVKIGVLAKRGYQKTLDKWSATAEYLSKKIDCCNFEIVPLSFKDINTAIKRAEVDFVITNSAQYVELEYQYGIARIATLENISNYSDKYYTKFGGVIFVRKDRRDISELKDIKNKKFMGVDKSSFGGYIMAMRELKANGIDSSDIDIYYGDTHDNVVYAVLKSKVDVGTVRSDTLERMTKERKIDINDFYIINKKEYQGFNFAVSTRLYPEWPIAKLKSTPHEISQKVVVALLQMSSEDQAAKDAMIHGWTIPLSYQPVHDAMKELKLSPYDIELEITLKDFLSKYWYIFLGSFLFIFF